ncbi:MAG: hypothetical protein R3Y12_05345 [Clostridia bacterium]
MTMKNLEKLFETFYKTSEQVDLNENIEKLRIELRQSVSDEDRRKILRIVDDMNLIKSIQLKESFVAGLKLGLEIKEELKNC